MPIRYCKYNPKRDKKAVQPGAAVDLKMAFKNGTLPAINDDSVLSGNNIVEPDSVMNGADDVFDLYRQSYTVRNFKADEETTE